MRTFQVVQLPCAPPGDEWGVVVPAACEKSDRSSKVFQYARMELCRFGDVESYMKTLPNEMLPLDATVDFAFQMAFAIHAAREQLSLRHHDVKLLNFFIGERSEGQAYAYAFADEGAYTSYDSRVVKLADYGTAETNKDFEGKCIEGRHFGTLENSPPEYLLEECPSQSWATDTFALGLAVLHLFTGCKPYEEILEDVTCPDIIAEALVKEWRSKPKYKHTALACLLDDGDESILTDTLYRYIVMLGIPSGESRVSKVLRTMLQGQLPRGKRGRCLSAVRNTYDEHSSTYSLDCGSSPMIARARERMDRAGMRSLVVAMLSFDPCSRPAMIDCLKTIAMYDRHTSSIGGGGNTLTFRV